MPFGEKLKAETSRKDHDRLIFHTMILERERFTYLHMKDFPNIMRGLRPDELVTPWFVDKHCAQFSAVTGLFP